jgi:predicted amidohydrolase YtcJ
MARTVLVRGATLLDGRPVDARIEGGRVAVLGRGLSQVGARVIEARGGALLPGLHDHHVHVAATAAARASIACGPPEVFDEAGLAVRLGAPGTGWLRGVGYHESVAGMLDRGRLDALAPDRPVRIQHRSGRMWFLNTCALQHLADSGIPAPEGLDPRTGRVFDADAWMRQALGGRPPAFDVVGGEWARRGVTGITDMSPANDGRMADHFLTERRRGALPQRVVLAGRADLDEVHLGAGVRLGPVKLHLHEARLPDFNDMTGIVRRAHERDRAIAVHCVSELELVYALASIREAGALPGDRIEHASVCPDHLVTDIVDLGLAVVSQPNFVSERGDAYRDAIPATEWPSLYRLRSFLTAGAILAGGTDTPFGDADPWSAMAAAVSRRTASGVVIGSRERLSPEEALALFLADPADLSRQRIVEVGAPGDICLLDRPWRDARAVLDAKLVRATLIDGQIVHDGVDETPLERRASADALA